MILKDKIIASLIQYNLLKKKKEKWPSTVTPKMYHSIIHLLRYVHVKNGTKGFDFMALCFIKNTLKDGQINGGYHITFLVEVI